MTSGETPNRHTEKKSYLYCQTEVVPWCFIPSFTSEVLVTVVPETDVRVVQSKVTTLLSLDYSFSHLKLTSHPESIVVLPIGMYTIIQTGVCLLSRGPNTGPCGTQQSPTCRNTSMKILRDLFFNWSILSVIHLHAPFSVTSYGGRVDGQPR